MIGNSGKGRKSHRIPIHQARSCGCGSKHCSSGSNLVFNSRVIFLVDNRVVSLVAFKFGLDWYSHHKGSAVAQW